MAAFAAVAPWWYTSTSSLGTTSTAEFFPGNTIYAGGGGGGGTTTYADYGAPSVGALFLTVLATEVVLVLLGVLVTVQGLGQSRGRWASPPFRRAARAALIGAAVLAVAIVIAVPLAQPVLYHDDDPVGSCSAPSPAGPCQSFWGTAHSAGSTTTWGAALGWWLALVSAVLLGLAFLLGALAPHARPERVPARIERRSSAATAASAAPDPAPPLALADLRRLAALKSQSDLGQIPPEEFLEAKRQLLAARPPATLGGPGPRTPLPSAELSLLKSLYTSGALSEDEYRLLERRALLWI